MNPTGDINFRKEILNSIAPNFRQDKRYYLLACDMGFGAIDRLREEFSDRVIMAGIMEPGTVGIASGMAMAGLIPVVYSIVNFLAFRALEQVRNDVVLQGLNVKFVGTGANDYFKFLGHSHCCAADDISIMKLINLKTYDPYSSQKPFFQLVQDWIKDEKAGYIRV